MEKSKELGVKLADAAHHAIQNIKHYEGPGNFAMFNHEFSKPNTRVGGIKLI